MAKKKKTTTTGGDDTPPVVLVYAPSQEAVQRPRRYEIKKGLWIGVGGEITIPAVPPHQPKPRVFREATQEEYKILFDRGLKHLVICSN